MRIMYSILALTALAGCSSSSPAPSAAIVTADLVQGGQLFCTVAGTLIKAGSVTVTDATSRAVSEACAAVTVAGQLVPGAVPAPAQPGAVAVLGTVPSAAVAAVDSSKAVGS
jgi:hypothetical protein